MEEVKDKSNNNNEIKDNENFYEQGLVFDQFCDMIELEHKVNRKVTKISNPNRNIIFTYLQGL